MKQLLLIWFFSVPLWCFSQDVIVTTWNDSIACEITGIMPNEIKFNYSNSSRKISMNVVSSYFHEGAWHIANPQDSLHQAVLVYGLSGLELDHIFYGSLQLQKGGSMIAWGLLITIGSSVVAFIDGGDLGTVVGVFGGIVGVAMTMSGGFHIRNAGKRLEQVYGNVVPVSTRQDRKD
jgi:hypothetical protein